MESEVNANTMSVALDAKIKRATILSILEDYTRYLLKQDNVDSKDSVKTKLSEIVSVAMDRGDCSVADLEHINEYLAKHNIKTKHSTHARKHSKFAKHVLIEEMDEIIGMGSGFAEGEHKEFMKAIEAQQVADELFYELKAKYIGNINDAMAAFFSIYGKMFEEAFLEACCFGSNPKPCYANNTEVAETGPEVEPEVVPEVVPETTPESEEESN